MKRTWLALSVVLLLGLGLALPVIAQTGGYDLTWRTIDGGGSTFSTSGGGYSLGGTIGQPDAAQMSGGAYLLDGGFWGRTTSETGQRRVYLPLILR